MKLQLLILLLAAACCNAGTILPGQTVTYDSTNLGAQINLLTSIPGVEFPIVPSAMILPTTCAVGPTCTTTINWTMNATTTTLLPGGARGVLAQMTVADPLTRGPGVSPDGTFKFFGRYYLFGSLYALDASYWEPFSMRAEFEMSVRPTSNEITMTLLTLDAFETPEPSTWAMMAVAGLLVIAKRKPRASRA